MDIVVTKMSKEYFTKEYEENPMFIYIYINNKLEVYLYSKYVWYLELLKANNIYKIIWHKAWYKVYTKIVKWYLSIFYKNNSKSYVNVNNEENKNNSELVIFAIAHNTKGESIGRLLLNELLKNGRRRIMACTETISDFHYYLEQEV